jgi:hypothetical protein
VNFNMGKGLVLVLGIKNKDTNKGNTCEFDDRVKVRVRVMD